jgi:hypothetical protein
MIEEAHLDDCIICHAWATMANSSSPSSFTINIVSGVISAAKDSAMLSKVSRKSVVLAQENSILLDTGTDSLASLLVKWIRI